jgi:hypothetical protein
MVCCNGDSEGSADGQLIKNFIKEVSSERIPSSLSHPYHTIPTQPYFYVFNALLCLGQNCASQDHYWIDQEGAVTRASFVRA